MILLRVALEFYDAEWCGILDIDNDVGVWTPFWWYNKELGAMAQSVLLQEFELMDGCGRWYECLQKQELVIIDDPEAIKEIYPEEYVLCQCLQVDYAISVPFWKGPKGFLVLKNPKRFQKQIGLLRMLTFALVSLINEYHLLESRKLTIISPRITNDTDVYITVLGDLKITTKAGVLSEDELKSPKISRLLVYLLMSRKSACSPREIVDALWPDEDVDNAVKNIKGLIYRLQHAFGLISEYRLIVSTTNGYQLNPKLNIFTDLHLFDKKWSIYVEKELQRVNRGAMADLDEKDIMFKFPPTLASTHTALVLKTPKTKTSIRKVFLPKTVAEMLVQRKAQIEELKELFGDEFYDFNLVICSSNGKPIEGQVVNRSFNRLIEKTGLPKVVFHSLRHSSITYKLKLNGGDMKSVQGDSGHAQVKMVADVYSHIIDDDRRVNAARLEEAFYSGRTAPQPETPPVTSEQPKGTVESDQELLLKLLQKPGVADLLKTLAGAL